MIDVKSIIVLPKSTVKDALKIMDATGQKILFIADSENALLGTLTDGDIRRWILMGRSLRGEVEKAMNANPVYIRNDYQIIVWKSGHVRIRNKNIPTVIFFEGIILNKSELKILMNQIGIL